MADLSTFERVFRVEVLKRKDNGDPAPSWSDVKRLVKERRLFDESEMQDPEFKNLLKEKATELAIAIMSTGPEEESPKPSKKRKPSSKQAEQDERPTKRIKQTASKASNKKEITTEDDSDVQMETISTKKRTSHKKVVKRPKQTVEDSNDEEEIPSKRTKNTKQREYSSAVDSDPEAPIPPKSPENVGMKIATEKRIPAADVAEMSDSALAAVIDGSPMKPKKTKKEGKKTEPKTSKGAKKEKGSKEKSKGATAADPDEEQIKRLKSFVIACGVRKKWAKEFEGIEDKPKKQIAHLKEILADLGMSGRMSLEKAKAIRAKRELAEELEEVVQFEKHRGMPKEEARTRLKSKKQDLPSDSTSEDEEKLAANPPARKKNILAFLDDQSEEE